MLHKVILVIFLASILLFQITTFGNFQEAEAHRTGKISECVKVKVKAELVSITITDWKGKSKTYFDPPGLATYDNYGEVELAYSFWEPDHQKNGGKADGVIDLSNWSLAVSKTIPYGDAKSKNYYPFPKHNIMLHDTCWDDVDKLVVTMAVQEQDDGESYKQTWYSGPMKKWWAGTIIESAVTAVVDKVVGGSVGTILTLPKSFYDAFHITKNDFLGTDSKIYDIGSLSLKKYHYFDFKTKGDSGQTTVKFRVVILEVPEEHAGLTLPSDESFAISDVPDESNVIMPEWFKNNAKWWKDGLISDAEIINALESLMIQDIIPLDKFVKTSSEMEQAGVSKTSDSSIPAYQKDVFGFWSDGVISDQEIVDSIGHLMSQGIINSKKIQEKREHILSVTKIAPQNTDIDSDEIKTLYELNKWNELTATWLLGAKNAESELLNELSDNAWSEYAKNKDREIMDAATNLEPYQKDAQNDADAIVKILGGIKNIQERLKEEANKLGISSADLEQSSIKITKKMEEIQKIENLDQIADAYREAEKANKQAKSGQAPPDSAVDDSGSLKPNPDKLTLDYAYPSKSLSEGAKFLEVIEKTGKFIGDPCDVNTQSMKISFKIKKSDGKPVDFGMMVLIDAYYNGKLEYKDEFGTPTTKILGKEVAVPTDTFEWTFPGPFEPGKYSYHVVGIRGDQDNPNEHKIWTYHTRNAIVIDVVVPPCNVKKSGGDSAVDDSDDVTVPDNYRSLPGAVKDDINKDSKKLSSIITDSQNRISILEKITKDLILGSEPEPLPGLDYEPSDDEIVKSFAGTTDVYLSVYTPLYEPSLCKDSIQLDISIRDNELLNDYIGYPIHVKIIENGPRGTLTHDVKTQLGSGDLILKGLPYGTYNFKIKSAILEYTNVDVYSGNDPKGSTEELSPCADESAVEPDSAVTNNESFDYTISVDYPMYRYVDDNTCNTNIDKHLFGWWVKIDPSNYDVDSGVFVGKIKVERYDGSVTYIDSPIYDETSINGNIEAGPPGSTSYATLEDIVSPTGLSINFDRSNAQKITMTTPQCSTEGDDSVDFERVIFVASYLIDGKYFPIYQFIYSEPDVCPSPHYHSATGTALSTDFVTINDPNPNGCGFVTSAAVPDYPLMTESDILEWESITGIDIPEN